MSWLAPLYLAGMLAVAAPILFHLWRRTPQGRRTFSTLMFLTPSPPRMTRLSKVEHWSLLSLRALALLLLALAFSRPVWRIPATIPIAPEETELVAILVDTSASLQRDGLWTQLNDTVTRRLDQLPDTSIPALFAFDDRWSAELSFGESEKLEPALRKQLIKDRLAALKPSFRGTNLGQALVRTAQSVQDAQTGRALPRPQRMWLAGDLQAGCDLRELLAYDWPDDLPVEWLSATAKSAENAGLQLVEGTLNSADDKLRVRITNAALATRQRFVLNWSDGATEAKCLDVVIPPGQSRVVALPAPPTPALGQSVVLSGDDHPFDNCLWLPSRQPQPCAVLFVGRDAPNDTDGLRYYLDRALASNPRYVTSIVTADEALLPSNRPSLIVAGEADAAGVDLLKKLTAAGVATVLVPKTVDDADALLAACGFESIKTREAVLRDYALWSDIDFESPWFAPFAEAQFADFSGIHFWKHRQIVGDLPEASEVLVRFDGGSPALVRLPDDNAKVWFFASGWHPKDSQLARSSKFVPLMWRIMESTLGGSEAATSLVVGNPLPRPESTAEAQFTTPNGTQSPWPSTGANPTADRPGVYTVASGSTRQTVAVNIPPDESRTDPLPPEQLEATGVKLSTKALRPALP
ncbi:MAG TPA: BatA domain-containing protein, partial [Planctomycetaceae bacterium]|nr:BatA domain-containing protein [Planctomycetaceae bacterium]